MQELNFINRLISSQDYALGFAMMVFYASVGFVILAVKLQQVVLGQA